MASPDVIHVRYFYTLFKIPLFLFLIKLLRKKMIVELPDVSSLATIDKEYGELFFLPVKNPLILKLVLLALNKAICMLADKIVVHTKIQRRVLEMEYRVPPKKVIVIPIAYKVRPLRKDEARAKLGIDQHSKVVLFFGYLAPYKGIDYLLRAFAHLTRLLPNAMLIVAGGNHPRLRDDYRSRLVKLADQLGVRDKVVFTGFVPDDCVPLYFSAADVIVLPYIYTSGASGPLALALQYSRPIIATDLPLFKEADSNVVIVPRRDEVTLAEAMYNLLTGRQEGYCHVDKSRRRKHDIERLAEILAGEYNEVLH